MRRQSRVHVRSAVIGGLVAGAMMLAAPPALSAAASLLLGQSNTSNARTTLTGSVTSANLRLENTNKKGSALALAVTKGSPPLKVNSSTKVKNLNADKLDGVGAGQLMRVAHAESTDVGFGVEGTMLSLSIEAPRSGFLVISGGVNGGQVGGTDSFMWCQFEIDGQLNQASTRLIVNKNFIADGDIQNMFSYCESSVTVPVAAGTHAVNLHWEATGPAPDPDEATLTALFVPFDGEGKRP